MTPLQAVQYVGTPIALVAFIVAVAAYAYRARLVERRKLIEAAPEADRAKLLDATIRDFTTVNTETLTREQRYQLALRLIEERTHRFRTLAVVGVVVAVLLSGLVVALRASGTEDEPVSLVVRVSDETGEFIRQGVLTLDAGRGRDTREIGSDGQVTFDNVPRAAFARGVSLTPEVAGFATDPSTLTAVPADGVHYLRLARRATRLFGTVIDTAHVPMAGVALDFGDGAARDTTDATGAFDVLLPQPPGARITVRGLREGRLGINDMATVPDGGAALTLIYAERR